MPRFAANLSMLFNEHGFLERFAAARSAGFEAVEYLFPYAHPASELAARLRDNGLAQVLFNAPPGDWEAGERGIGGLPGREAEFRASIETALAYAEALRCPRIHVMAGLVPAGADLARHLDVFAGNLAQALPLARAAGIELLLEPLNPRDFPGYLIPSVAEALAMIDRVGGPGLGLQFDIYHTQMGQGFVAGTLEAALPRVRHVQIAGVPGRHEPDAEQELNYPYLFALLDRFGYQGWVGCEYRPRAGTRAGLAWAEPWGIGSATSR